MDPKCSLTTRCFQKNAQEILRRYGPGCSQVYVNAALFKREPGRQSSVLFVKVPPKPTEPPAGVEHRAIERDGVWQLPGAECSRLDTTITQRLWLEVFNYLSLQITKIEKLILKEIVTVDDKDATSKKVLVLTFEARVVERDLDIAEVRYVAHH